MISGFGGFSCRDNTPEEQHAAALTACHYADTVDDARDLLKALGIIPDPEAKPIHHIVQLGYVKTRSKARRRDDTPTD